MQKHLLCFGYGYTAAHLSRYLIRKGWRVTGTTRDPERCAEIKSDGVRCEVFDSYHPLNDPLSLLASATHILVSTPPNDTGDPVLDLHGADLENLNNLQWLGYLSATTVYGDRSGIWVDEDCEPRPTTRRGSLRLRAEEQWENLWRVYGLPVHIFRLAGIYGPGRSAIDSVRAGTARRIDKPGHAFSRIHVDDIVQTLLASIGQPNPGRIYNVADDMAAPSHEVIKLACELLGKECPPLIPFDQAEMAPIARSFYSDNKRIRNNRIKEELGVKLQYPDYTSGIRACLESEHNPAGIPSEIETRLAAI